MIDFVIDSNSSPASAPAASSVSGFSSRAQIAAEAQHQIVERVLERQDAVLAGLDELNERIEAMIKTLQSAREASPTTHQSIEAAEAIASESSDPTKVGLELLDSDRAAESDETDESDESDRPDGTDAATLREHDRPRKSGRSKRARPQSARRAA